MWAGCADKNELISNGQEIAIKHQLKKVECQPIFVAMRPIGCETMAIPLYSPITNGNMKIWRSTSVFTSRNAHLHLFSEYGIQIASSSSPREVGEAFRPNAAFHR